MSQLSGTGYPITWLCPALIAVVDSLKPSEIIVSFTSFSNWLDTQQPAQMAPVPSLSNPSHTALSKTGKESKEAKTPDRAPGTADAESDQVSVTAGEGKQHIATVCILPRLYTILYVSLYCWLLL